MGRQGSREGQGRGCEEKAAVQSKQRVVGDLGGAGPLTEAGGEVWAGAVSGRTDALEGAVGVGTEAALAKVLLAALIHIWG